MKFKSLHVENIRSYKHLDIDFKDGVTVISGVNGSGKSSILEACFIGLFGAGALFGTSLAIPDMIRKGSTVAEIALEFEHKGADYRIEQQFKVQKSGAAGNTKSILYKNGEIVAEQAKKTYAALCELLNMDEKNFQNCAYIRQGDVDALINAKPKERQQMIDDLLQLGKLEEYRERTNMSKTAVNRVLRQEGDRQKEIQKKAADMKEKNLFGLVNDRKKTLEDINAAVSELREQKEAVGKESALLDTKMKELKESEKELETLSKEKTVLENEHRQIIVDKEETVENISSKEKRIAELRNDSRTVKNEITDLCGNEETEELINNIPALVSKFKTDEKAANDQLHHVSKALELMMAEKETLKKQTAEKENEKKKAEEILATVLSKLKNQEKDIEKMNREVESGFSDAQIQKDEFLVFFEDILEDFKKSMIMAGTDPVLENKNNSESSEQDMNFDAVIEPGSTSDTECKPISIGPFEDMSFCFSLVKAEDLPIPSDAELWKNLMSDIERLETFILQKLKEDERRQNEPEMEIAQISGELEEKKKRREEAEKDIRELEIERERIESDLQTETKAAGTIVKSRSDFHFVLSESQNKRNVKIKLCPAFLETVSKAHLDFMQIEPADVEKTYDFAVKKQEEIVAEKAKLSAEKTGIEKEWLKKEELFKSGKCPTCGQVVPQQNPSDAGTTQHTHAYATDAEMKRLDDISATLLKFEENEVKNRAQLAVLKEIKDLDVRIEELNSKMKTGAVEESGKKELIEKYKRDLIENEKKRTEKAAQRMENKIFCETRQKDLEALNRRLLILKGESAKRTAKAGQLTAKKKMFADTANGILRNYMSLENLKKLKEESENRKGELEKSVSDLASAIESQNQAQTKMTENEEKTRAEKQIKEKAFTQKADLLKKAELLALISGEEEKAKLELSALSDKIKHLDGTVVQYRRQMAEKTDKINRLSLNMNALKSFEGATLEEKRTENKRKELEISGQIKEWEAHKSTLTEQIGMLQSEIKQLHQLEDDAKILRNKIGFLALVLEDVTALEDMYLKIRADMRSRNIEALDILLNDMFEFIYSNNAYSHLELDADYNLKVYEKDGSVLEPKQLSGGERAIFNLALRCAIYRLLSLGFGEDNRGKTALPPLIFDEPTVFLDSGHVGQLIKLIDRMKEDGVGQIIVVSHDESLIGSADQNFRIEKDSLTNASELANT
ncbi:AAA family ATPase [Methanolapillus millepedarum]|uniref:DNA double-strand break repair Rad50 ATPase n=1 Tax=Methanolapillus millepedarum TaxID=3028296 RepID=A0AA97A4L8_9EURY|nr:Chromosome partition protein Smc [Methanosarcinaceae archaeon Ac7]